MRLGVIVPTKFRTATFGTAWIGTRCSRYPSHHSCLLFILKSSTDGKFFLWQVLFAVRQKIDKFPLPRSLLRKLVMPALEKEGLFVWWPPRKTTFKTWQVYNYKKYFYGFGTFGKQNAALTWDKCLTTFRAHKQQSLSRNLDILSTKKTCSSERDCTLFSTWRLKVCESDRIRTVIYSDWIYFFCSRIGFCRFFVGSDLGFFLVLRRITRIF